MLRLLAGDPEAAQLVAFNPWTISSSIGHWILVLLLTVVSPFTATKVMVTVTYAGVVAAVGFLRFTTAGHDGMATSLLIGAAIGFNWLWLNGLYSFQIGAIGLAVTLGLFFRWQCRLRPGRIVGLSALLLFVYVSHIVTFGALVAALVFMALSSEPRERRAACLGLFASLVPVTFLALTYGVAATDPSLAGDRLFPVWRRLSDPWSIVSWISHIRTADPFFLISRRAVPFVTETSGAFAVFTPLLWLLAAAAVLAYGTVSARMNVARSTLRRGLPLIVILAVCTLAAAFGPDDFGTGRGTLLRERLAFLAAMLFVPFYRIEGTRKATRTFVHLCLAGVILFQAAATWDYARQTSRDADEFLAMGDTLNGHASVASIIVLENGLRFPSNPIAEISNVLGIGRQTVVWDNYQLGYTLFPVVARNQADRRFVYDLTRVNVLDEAAPAALWEAKVAKLAAFVAEYHSRMETVLVWRGNAQLEQVLERWYETEPFFEYGRGRLYRRRSESGPIGRAAGPAER